MFSRKVFNRFGLLTLELACTNANLRANKNTLVAADSAIVAGIVEPFIKENCLRCHGPDTSKGELRLDQVGTDFTKPSTLKRWREILSRVQSGDMPPDMEPRLKPEPLTDFVKQLTARLCCT